jgi:hypothetical protein
LFPEELWKFIKEKVNESTELPTKYDLYRFAYQYSCDCQLDCGNIRFYGPPNHCKHRRNFDGVCGTQGNALGSPESRMRRHGNSRDNNGMDSNCFGSGWNLLLYSLFRFCNWISEQEPLIMAGKYTPLEDYLRNLAKTQKEEILSFEQIEIIILDRLPSSAYEDRRWWDHEKEGNHVNARAWANAGWKVDEVNFDEKWVKFIRL